MKVLLAISIMMLAVVNVSASVEEVTAAKFGGAMHLDFEDARLGDGTQYLASHGVKFTGENSKVTAINRYNRAGYGTSSGQMSISNSANFPATSQNVPFEISFEEGASAVGFYLGNGASNLYSVTLKEVNLNNEAKFEVNGQDLGFLGEGDRATLVNDAYFTVDSVNSIDKKASFILDGTRIEIETAETREMGGNSVIATVTLYGAAGNVLGSHVYDDVQNPVEKFVGFVSDDTIYKVAIDYGNTMRSEEIDDLMWVSAVQGDYLDPDSLIEDPIDGFCNDGSCLRERLIEEAWCSHSWNEKLTMNGQKKFHDKWVQVVDVEMNNSGATFEVFDGSQTYKKKHIDICETQEINGLKITLKKVIYDDRDLSGSYSRIMFDVEPILDMPQPTHCGDAYGGDGYYAVCKGDIISHEAGLDLKVLSFDTDFLLTEIEGSNGKQIEFDREQEVIVFDYEGQTYKVEFNSLDTTRAVANIYIGYGGKTGTAPDTFTTPVLRTRQAVTTTDVVTNALPSTCGGCDTGNCLPYGTRLVEKGSPMYCALDGKLAKQKDLGQTCQNNYECATNQCSNGQCIDLQGELRDTRNLVESFIAWFKQFFN